ncbi:MAG: NAD(P)-dependent oxidoreductase [Chroococcidiopsidaceae cyanobacterium CP_BM_ER_R8_30]|nr:NAD(P)-dependent oxidoreductase [Chroococcidiopsidaceae cyanobacterium CP_BM_ER_R8_30]
MKRILVTGASGCIGHYLSEDLIQETDHELYLLVRNPKKLQLDTQSRPGVTVLQGDMAQIGQLADLLKTIDIAVLTATAWGGQELLDTNVLRTIELLNLLDPAKCQQVIYFSTASLLDRHNQVLKEAGEIGHDYIRSKHECLRQLSTLAIAPQTTVVFPTVVMGGDGQKPYSHLSAGLPEFMKWMNLIRFFQADGSFHFIHGRDIARVVRYLINHPPQEQGPHYFVLGQAPLTLNQTVTEFCAYLGKKIYFRIPLSMSLADFFIVLFRLQMADWDRFCMRYRHFTYEKAVNPASFGLTNYCATLTDLLKISGIARGGGKSKAIDNN